MAGTGVPLFYLPQLSPGKPEDPHIAVYMTVKEKLMTKKRIIVVVNACGAELGIWSFRALFGDEGLLGASNAFHLAEEMNKRGDPGLLILNPGQILYSFERNRCMSTKSWRSRDRPSAIHTQPATLPINFVPGNATTEDHVQFVFENILSNPEFVDPCAKIDIIGLLDGGNDVVAYLNQHCENP